MRLSEQEIERYRKIIVDQWKTHKLHEKGAVFEAPLGEWIGNLAGFAWAWKMRGDDVPILPLTKTDRFNAQGLEGKVRIETNLATAIVMAVQCDENRRVVYVRKETSYTSRKAPLLVARILDGSVHFDMSTKEYVGIASDGVEVGLGSDPDGVEKYLVANPTPDCW